MSVAIVTGAARGIGAATAVALAEAGHQLILIDRCSDDPRVAYRMGTEDELLAVARTCDAKAIVGDAGDPTIIGEAVDAANELGGVGIAVAAAGVIAGEGNAWEVSDEAHGVLEETNVSAVRRLARATIPSMLEQPRPRYGRFVVIGSPIANKATPQLSAYAASKAAVESFVRSMAADLAGSDITANIVLPGSTDTDLLAHSATVYSLDHPSDFVEHHIVDRLVQPTEVAAAIAWLCSRESGAVTGASIAVDGGMTAL